MFSFSLRTCWSTTDEERKKRVKQLFDEGFYFGTKSSICRFPVLKCERLDLLLACLVFKKFHIILFIMDIIQYRCSITLLQESFWKKMSVRVRLMLWVNTLSIQSFTTSAASNSKIWVLRIHSESLLLHLNVRFSLRPNICCLCWGEREKERISGVRRIEHIERPSLF